MARTLEIYRPDGFYDEAIRGDGEIRPEYRRPLAEIARDPAAAAAAAGRTARELDARFGAGEDAEPFLVDAVPRIVTAEEWSGLERGLRQRALALNRFLLDAYGAREIVAAGIVPAEVIEGAAYHEPVAGEIALGYSPATVIGFDVVRGADGELEVLEDNSRTPSGFAYALAARRVSEAVFGELPDDVLGLDRALDVLAAALRAAAPGDGADPRIVLLSEGAENGAWYEHERLAALLGHEIARPGELRFTEGRLRTLDDRAVDVVYRRTDEDRFVGAAGEPTAIGRLLLEPLREGAVAVVNAPGTGLADDKLIHGYVGEMVRFYLGEEPAIGSVHTHDLRGKQTRDDVRERLDEVVVKPRSASGGKGVMIGPRASERRLELADERIESDPGDTVAQEMVALSTHPTVCDGRLEPRHVDLRAFALTSGDEVTIVPGGLTRVALERGSMIVNSSNGGGAKDTWVLRE
ncbi:MAG TPA: circularly permuted type 2 ATP-grasp protein [Solirubrobacterales bacterium]